MLCSICNCRINQTAIRIKCLACETLCHKLCIPGINRYDDFYTNIVIAKDWICPKCNGSIFPFNHIDDKYWNWCRCIQRKDSAGVILTASWFNDIIRYRFHISTVCHSCCNNVMYFSKENLDISGSAWKKYHAGMAFLLARIVLVLKLYIQGESCVRPMQASAARLRPGSGILFMTYIDICII